MAVTINAHTAVGPVTTPEDLVSFSQTDQLVMATPFLLWQPAAAIAGVAQVALSQQAMMAHFINCCDRDAADAATLIAFNTLTALNLAFEGAFGSRILTECVASGLLAADFSDLPLFHLAMAKLTITTPAADLVILALDTSAGTPHAPLARSACSSAAHALQATTVVTCTWAP